MVGSAYEIKASVLFVVLMWSGSYAPGRVPDKNNMIEGAKGAKTHTSTGGGRQQSNVRGARSGYTLRLQVFEILAKMS